MSEADGRLVPFSPGKNFKPPYYLRKRSSWCISSDTDCWDICEAYDIGSPQTSQAIKYILRAGHKPGTSYEADITKAVESLTRELEFLKSRNKDGE